MLQRVALLVLGVLMFMHEVTSLLALPKDFSGEALTRFQSIPVVTSSSIRATLYFPARAEAEEFQTPCYLASEPCEWVRNNPGISVYAEVLRASWPSHGWLVSMKASNGFTLDPTIQVRELADFKRRTAFGIASLIALTLAVWLYWRRQSASVK